MYYLSDNWVNALHWPWGDWVISIGYMHISIQQIQMLWYHQKRKQNAPPGLTSHNNKWSFLDISKAVLFECAWDARWFVLGFMCFWCFYTICIYPVEITQLHNTSVLSFYIDVVLTLSMVSAKHWLNYLSNKAYHVFRHIKTHPFVYVWWNWLCIWYFCGVFVKSPLNLGHRWALIYSIWHITHYCRF